MSHPPPPRRLSRRGWAHANAEHGRAETINFEEVGVYDQPMEMTSGRGPDRCIDAVGAEAQA